MIIDPSQEQVLALETLARSRFSNLSAAEAKLLNAIPKGSLAICGPDDNSKNPDNDPGNGGQWGPDRQIRADLIRWLCIDPHVREFVDPRGIQVYGARVSETLDLSHAIVPFAVTFRRCRLAQVLLEDMGIPELSFPKTMVSTMKAPGINVAHDVVLNNGFSSEGLLDLAGAKIGGSLNCGGCKLSNPLQSGVPDSGIALRADNLVVDGNFILQGASADGEVAFRYAQIGGVLDCRQARFNRPGGFAISADRLTVKGAIFLQSLTAKGTVQLQAAQVGAELICRDSIFNSPGSVALNAEGISTTGDVFLDGGFHADGQVNLNGAQIGGNIGCQNATFNGPLDIKGAKIANNIVLTKVSFNSPVNLTGTQVGSNVDCSGASFNSEFTAQRVVIKGALSWINIIDSSRVTLDLQGASATSISDDAKSWPQHGKLKLDGFVYQYIFGPRDSKDRLAWLRLMDSFAPQPYRRLAEVLGDANDESGARSVRIEMERLQRSKDSVELPWSAVLRLTTGYGYSPLRALGGLTLLTGVGWIIYRRGQLAKTMTPTDEVVYRHYKHTGRLPEHYERFSPGIYSLENSLPLVSLGQAARWQPDPDLRIPADPATGKNRLDRLIASSAFLRRFLWIQILLGWILATLFAAGVTGIIHSR